MSSLKHFVCNLYVSFTKGVCDQSFSHSDISLLDEKTIKSFLKDISPDMNEQQITNLFIFQYHYWSSLNNLKELSFRKFPLSWILGKKALKRFYDNPFKDLTKAKGELQKFNIRIDNTKQHSNSSTDQVRFHEEKIKAKHLNSELGWIICVEQTTLYHPQSSICSIECIFQQNCKEQLQKEYPSIFTHRGLIPSRLNTRRTQ